MMYSRTAVSQDQRQILESLPAPDLYKTLDGIVEPFSDTFDWVARSVQFRDWLTSKDFHVLHISGPPGSGKTVLSAFLFRKALSQVTKSRLIYFTFQDRSDSQYATSAWASLISQLLSADNRLFSQLDSHLRMAGGLSTRTWSEARLKQTFEDLACSCELPCIFIIDALDQTDNTADKLLASFANVLERKNGQDTRFLFSSRTGLANLLDAYFPTMTSIDLEEQPAHEESIVKFIRHMVDGVCRKRRGLRQCQHLVVDKLSQSSKGMYLLPVMALESLSNINATAANIMKSLEELPDSLRKAYNAALDRVHPDNRALTCRVLLWTTFASRPLSVEELASAVALSDNVADAHGLEAETSLDLLGDGGVVEIVGSLLKIQDRGDDQFVSLVHHSVKEFLLVLNRGDEASGLSPPLWIIQGLYPSQGVANHPLLPRLDAMQHSQPLWALDPITHLQAQPNTNPYWRPYQHEPNRPHNHFHHPASSKQSAKERGTEQLASKCIQYMTLTALAPPRNATGGPMDLLRTGLNSAWTSLNTSLPDVLRTSMAIFETSPNSPHLPSTGLHHGEQDGVRQITTIPEPWGYDAFQRFPALRYCIESLPDHIRDVQDNGRLIHENFAAFLLGEWGCGYISTFWALRDPGQDYRQQKALHFSASLGLINVLRHLLKPGESANSRDGYGNTVLDVAVSTGDLKVIDLLLKTGNANIHAAQMMSMPVVTNPLETSNVLHTAAWYGHKDAVGYLLGMGADPNRKDHEKHTPLDIAVSTRNRAVIDILVQKGGGNGEPLHSAIRRGCLETVKFLIQDFGIDPLVQAQAFTYCPLHTAVDSRQLQCVSFLMQYADNLDAKSSLGQNPFHLAVARGYTDVADILATHESFDINAVGEMSQGSLHIALLQGETAMAIWLLEHGIDQRIVDADDRTAFEILLNERCRPRFKPPLSDEDRWTVFQRFSSEDFRVMRPSSGGNWLHVLKGVSRESHSEKIVRVFLDDWKLDPCERDDAGRTAVAFAVGDDDDRFALLLERCDCLEQRDDKGQTMIYAVLSSSHANRSERLNTLLTREVTVAVSDNEGNTPLHIAARDCPSALECLSTATDLFAMRNAVGKTPLHILLEEKNTLQAIRGPLVAALRKGADVKTPDDQGRTVLHMAALRNDDTLDQILDQDIGTSINRQDKEGRTPFHIFLLTFVSVARNADRSSLSAPKVTRLANFLSKGADLNIRDNVNRTPLMAYVNHVAHMQPSNISVQRDLDGTITLLIEHGAVLEDMGLDMNTRLLRNTILLGHFEDAAQLYAAHQLADMTNLISDEMPLIQFLLMLNFLTEQRVQPWSDDDIRALLKAIDKKSLLENVQFGHFKVRMPTRRIGIACALFAHPIDLFPYLCRCAVDAAYDGSTGDLQYLAHTASEHYNVTNIMTTAALSCVSSGRLDGLKTLIESSVASPDSTDHLGRTLLSLASEKGDMSMVEYLSTKTQSLGVLDRLGRTEMYWAARVGNLDMVKLLLKIGAKPTPFAVEVGSLYGHEDVSKFLRALPE
jgi:ankyrin repeat protein